MLKPYIGITDFMTFEQVTRMLKVFMEHKKPTSKRQLHIGVMMSYKTLNNIETKWSKAFPAKETIDSIFKPAKGNHLYYCLHYADYNNETSELDLANAIRYASFIDALQLDMIWPEPRIIAGGINRSRRQPEVILQIGKNAIEETNSDPDEVVYRLEEYDGVIDRVLLDKSMGRGLSMDTTELIPFARAIKDRFHNLGLVFAGGLGPDTINLIEPIVKEFPDLSIDAQGRLRPSGNAIDPIDWDMASEYLIKALEILK